MRELENALHYFAAHAPEVPDWFRYTEPDAPTAPPPEGLTEIEARRGRDLASEDLTEDCFRGLEINEGRRAKILKYAKVYGEYLTERLGYSSREAMNKMVAWRYAYADAMVRGGVDAEPRSMPGFSDPLVKLHIQDLRDVIQMALRAMHSAVSHLENCEAGKIAHPFKSASLPLLRSAIEKAGRVS